MNNDCHTFPATFIQHASVIGRFALGSGILGQPVNAASQILDEFKTAARYLKSACSISQSEALEALSIASGFKHWHEFNQHLKLANTFESKAPQQWVQRFCALTPLLIDIDPDETPSEYAQEGITHFCARLCQHLGCSPLIILDGLFARLCHDSQWSSVINRHPINAHAPYYRFVLADQFSSAHFVQTTASQRLYDSIEKGLNLKVEEDLITFVHRLHETIEKRPDYIEGWLYVAEIYLEHDPEMALHLANGGISAAEAMMPKGFRGKLEWGYHENRHYLRLIQNKMMAHEKLFNDHPKHIDQAIKCARKIARLSFNLKEWATEKRDEYLVLKNQNLNSDFSR